MQQSVLKTGWVPTRKSSRLGNAAQVSALEDGQSTARDPAQGKGTLRMTDVDTTTSSPTPSATCNWLYLLPRVSVIPFKRNVGNVSITAKQKLHGMLEFSESTTCDVCFLIQFCLLQLLLNADSGHTKSITKSVNVLKCNQQFTIPITSLIFLAPVTR